MTTTSPSLLPHATRDLAAFSSRLQYSDIPPQVVERIKLSVLDTIGCCLFGITLPWTRMVLDMVESEGCLAHAALFGTGRSTSISNAVLVNSTAAHAFELDDLHKESMFHSGSLTTPVALAFAEARGMSSGKDIITAMVAGYEVGTRVGNASTTELFLRGFHPQGTAGVFSAAATAARALNLDAAHTQHALGIVGSQAGGLMAAQEGAMVKRLHSGRAAQSGVYAALLAQRGFTGITDVLEAPYGGFLSSLSGKPNAQKLTAGLGTVWETLKVGYKPHAAVAAIHTALDALAAIMRGHKLAAGDIASVDVGLSHPTHVHCAWPYQPQGGIMAAQMNLYYSMAVMALDGAAFVDQYSERRLADPEVLAFASRVHAHVDPAIDAMGDEFRHASRLTVATNDGRRINLEMLHRRGSPENPLAPADVVHKFRNVMRSCLSPARMERVIDLVQSLEELDNTGELIGILGAPTAS